MKIKKAIIPAAGLGTRFLPATKAQPKEMLPIVDKPTIQYIVREAIDSGITDIMIISGRGKRAIEDHFDKSYELEDILRKKGKLDLLEKVEEISQLANIHYIRQKEPKGLGHAISCTKSFIGDEPFAILLGDDIVSSEKPCLKQLIECYDKYNTSVIGVQEVPERDVSKYGIVSGEKIDECVYKINDLVEKPTIEEAPSRIAILGRYIITPGIFECIEKTKPGKGGEIQLTDALRLLIQTENMYACEFTGKRYDVGNRLGFLMATVEHALKRDDLKDEFYEYLKNLIEGKD